jgi:hypothetical protein
MLYSMDSGIPTREEIRAMTVVEYKVLENRLRRAADRQGLRLEKSRARDPHAVDHGTYQFVDQRNNSVVKQDRNLPRGFGLDLHDVARFLFEDINVNVHDGPEWGPWPEFPFVEYRSGNTPGARVKGKLIEDGWVLNYGDGDEHILGVWDDAEAAVRAAKDELRRKYWDEMPETEPGSYKPLNERSRDEIQAKIRSLNTQAEALLDEARALGRYLDD